MINEIDVTWGRAAKVWWSLAWRMLLFTVAVSFVAGGILGFVGAMLGASQQTVSTLGFLIGVAVGVPIGIWIIKLIIGKNYSDFRLALVPRNEPTPSA